MIKPEEATHVYIGRNQCGCVTCVVTDLGDKFTAGSVADFIRSGCPVERVTFEQWRTMAFGCKCPKPAKAQQAELFQ